MAGAREMSAAAQEPTGGGVGEGIRVCMVCKVYLPYFSGAATQAHRLGQRLVERGLGVLVLTARHEGTVAHETVEGIPVERVPLVTSRSGLWSRLSLALGVLFALFRNRHRFDVLHVHSVTPFDFFPLLLARWLGKKTVIKMTLLGSPSDPATWSKNRLGPLMRFTFSRADRVVSISAPLSENYRQSGLDVAKLRQMPQGVDVNRFAPVSVSEKAAVRETLGLHNDATYLCFVGSFKERKGADILVEAFLALADTHPRLRLLAVGSDLFDDPIRAEKPYAAFAAGLKDRIRRAGLSERVVFTGHVDNVEEYLQASDLFVFPSRREGFGTAIIEAMAVGLPCVLAGLEGIAAEITARKGVARIVDSELAEAYATEISSLLASPWTAADMGQRARQRVVEEYAMEKVAGRYIDLYRELLEPESKAL